MRRSVLVWFRDGFGEPLGDYNEKGGFFTNDPGWKDLSECKERRGTKEIQLSGGNGDGAEPASPSRRLEGSGAPSRAPRSAETGAGLPPALRGLGSPCPECLTFVIKNIHASQGALFIRPRQQAPAALHRGMLEVGRRAGAQASPRARAAGPALSTRRDGPGASSPSLGLPACPSVSTPAPPPRAVPALPCS